MGQQRRHSIDADGGTMIRKIKIVNFRRKERRKKEEFMVEVKQKDA